MKMRIIIIYIELVRPVSNLWRYLVDIFLILRGVATQHIDVTFHLYFPFYPSKG